MSDGREIEIEPEVRHWLDSLSDRDCLQAEHAAERLLDAPTALSDPYLRDTWVTGYANSDWLAPRRRMVLLTVFRKTRMQKEMIDRSNLERRIVCGGCLPCRSGR